MADNHSEFKGEIAVLIGFNLYWNDVQVLYMETRTSCSQKQAGLASTINMTKVKYISHTHVIITGNSTNSLQDEDDELVHSLQIFWEVKSIEILDPLVAFESELFLSSFIFKNDYYEQ